MPAKTSMPEARKIPVPSFTDLRNITAHGYIKIAATLKITNRIVIKKVLSGIFIPGFFSVQAAFFPDDRILSVEHLRLSIAAKIAITEPQTTATSTNRIINEKPSSVIKPQLPHLLGAFVAFFGDETALRAGGSVGCGTAVVGELPVRDTAAERPAAGMLTPQLTRSVPG